MGVVHLEVPRLLSNCFASVMRSSLGCRWNGYTTFLTTGAGSWGETADSCGSPGSYLYSNGGERASTASTAENGMPCLVGRMVTTRRSALGARRRVVAL